MREWCVGGQEGFGCSVTSSDADLSWWDLGVWV